MFGPICGVIGINLIYGFYGQGQLLLMKFVSLKPDDITKFNRRITNPRT
jgi:hypothetical protein